MTPVLRLLPESPDPHPPRRPTGHRYRARWSFVPRLLRPRAVVPTAQPSAPVPPGLVAAAQAGDRDAMNQLCSDLWGLCYCTAFSVLRRHDLAEDCAQVSVFIISQLVQRLDVSRNVTGFARRIALHEALRLWRRWLQPTSDVDDELPSRGPTPFEVAARADMLALFRIAIEHLPPKHRAALQLRMNDASMQDIAASLGIEKLGTVRSLLSRAYDQVRRNPSLAAAAA